MRETSYVRFVDAQIANQVGTGDLIDLVERLDAAGQTRLAAALRARALHATGVVDLSVPRGRFSLGELFAPVAEVVARLWERDRPPTIW